MKNIESVREFKTIIARRIFRFTIWLSIIGLFVIYIKVYDCISTKYPGGFCDILKNFLTELICSLLVSVIVSEIFFYLIPKEEKYASVDFIEPKITLKFHEEAAKNSVNWTHNGHVGSWVRKYIFEKFKENSKSKKHSIKLLILDPLNKRVCDDYIDYKTSIVAISVRWCHSYRSNCATLKELYKGKKSYYSAGFNSFLKDAPLRSIL